MFITALATYPQLATWLEFRLIEDRSAPYNTVKHAPAAKSSRLERICLIGNLLFTKSQDMKFITIDGDDVGQRIASCYLSNDAKSLQQINELMSEAVNSIAKYLISIGFKIIFCAADGVAGYIESDDALDDNVIFERVSAIASNVGTFSAGTGSTLREAYIALLSAKSNGKSKIHSYFNLK